MEARKVEREKEEKIGADDRSGGDETAMPRLHYSTLPLCIEFWEVHELSWSIMKYHEVSWTIMIYHEVSHIDNLILALQGQKRAAADPPADVKERPEFTVVETIESLVSKFIYHWPLCNVLAFLQWLQWASVLALYWVLKTSDKIR